MLVEEPEPRSQHCQVGVARSCGAVPMELAGPNTQCAACTGPGSDDRGCGGSPGRSPPPELSRPDLRQLARALWIVSWPFFTVVSVVLGIAVLVEPQTLVRRVEVDGLGLVVCRTGNDGDVAAFGELCPHLAAPMSDGWVDRGRLVCPWHGSRFDVCSGAVLRGPSAAPLPRYETRINDGMIELRGNGQHSEPPPRVRSGTGGVK